ncbi:MAG: hypothetical protein NTX95_00245 [Actinobacteria bacterium]|nr:hypothetical protein [Actinomycetota bacterium]
MQPRTGQATIELLAAISIVAALVAALAAAGAFGWLPRALDAAAMAIVGAEATTLPRDDVAFLDRAIARGPEADGPMLRDGITRLAQSIGPDAARALAIDHLLRRYAVAPTGRVRALGDPSLALARPAYSGVGPGTTELWSEESPRASATARIITRDDERRWEAAQRMPLAAHAVELGASGAIALAGMINPETAVVSAAMSVGAAAMDVPTIAIPSGSREDDVLICRIVWRRNRAAPGWAAEHPVDALRLALDQRVPAVELVVIRAGVILSHDVVRSHASAC